MQKAPEEWPLRKLNLFAMPISIGLAIWAGSFWWPLLMAAAASASIALVMATLWVSRLREQLTQLEQSNPLMHLYHGQIPGGTDPSLQARFIFVQSLSGALIGAMWFAIAYGVMLLVT